MIFKRVKETSKFLDYVFQEADDDAPKGNRKIIKVRKPGGRRTDFTQGSDLADPEPPDEDLEDPVEDDTDYEADDSADTSDDAETPDEPIEDDINYSLDDGGDTPDASNDGEMKTIDAGGGADAPEGGDEPVTDDTDYSDDGADAGGDTEGAPDEPVTDDTDYTSDDGGGDDSADTSTDDSGSDDGSGGGASTDEQIRKYALYRKFMKLNKILDTSTEVLSNSISDNSEINQKMKSVTKKLKETNKLLSEYMIIKFQNASYIQSMLFYQRVLAIVDINYNILRDLKKEISKNANS